jgi:hypothetical protein
LKIFEHGAELSWRFPVGSGGMLDLILFLTTPIILSLSWGMCEHDRSLMNTQETFSGLAQQKI